MVRFLKFVIIAPIAILLLIFAFANRHFVTVSFDPFASGDIPAFAIQAPLFVVLIAAIDDRRRRRRRGDMVRAGQASPRGAAKRVEADKWRAEAESGQGAGPRAARLAGAALNGTRPGCAISPPPKSTPRSIFPR